MFWSTQFEGNNTSNMIENWKSLDELLAATWIGKDNFLKIIRENPEYIDQLLKISIGDQNPQSWRAAWLIRHAVKDDPRVDAYIDRYLEVIPKKNDGHQRELLLVLANCDLNEDQEGELLNICFDIWEGIAKKSSTRITAFKFILKMVKKYPELKDEIKVLTEEHYTETLTLGMQRMLSKLIAKY